MRPSPPACWETAAAYSLLWAAWWPPLTERSPRWPRASTPLAWPPPDGMELLIHVGINTVEMNGEGFVLHCAEGDQVKAGQLLLEFDIDRIKQGGYSTTTAVLVTNSEDLGPVTVEVGAQERPGPHPDRSHLCFGQLTYKKYKDRRDNYEDLYLYYYRSLEGGGLLVKAAKAFAGTEITLTKGDKTVKGTQLMKLMGLGVKTGDTVTVTAEGVDEENAIAAMEQFFQRAICKK